MFNPCNSGTDLLVRMISTSKHESGKKSCRTLVGKEMGTNIESSLTNHFDTLQKINGHFPTQRKLVGTHITKTTHRTT